ncbi:MAG: tetratricopeptide repeat protein [Betaproteobacteria bacterium]
MMKSLFALCLTLLLPALLAACASVPVAQQPTYLFADHLFPPPSERINAADVFAASDKMRSFLKNDIADLLQTKGPQQGLIDLLNNKSQLQVQYDSASTRNAAQTFEDRAGNCLSLVIMTASLARELGMSVHFQSVFVDETWSRSGGMFFTIGHVNLMVGKRTHDIKSRIDDNVTITIDFIPPQANKKYYTWAITEKTVLAMYMNNRAAEALARGQVNDAYWWAREAVIQDPTFLSAYNTLGVVYRHSGNLPQAEKALNYAMERDSGNSQVMSNLAMVLNQTGRVVEAQALTAKVERRHPYAPFYFFTLGTEAMKAGDYKTARDMFQRELARDPYNHEFHFGLAVALARLGDMAESKRHLTVALDFSTTLRERDLYAAKLDKLKAVN